jgi:hypothetical protein
MGVPPKAGQGAVSLEMGTSARQKGSSVSEATKGLLGILFFCMAGPTIIFVNKYTLSKLNFPFPITMCLLQDLFALFISWMAVRVLKVVELRHTETVRGSTGMEQYRDGTRVP